ncbi:GumC family protein [Aureimonas ureilytica]|uniref:GumC family protein n=1 Tax=Aureimonas ureilytica TaxID=401562 RepID=UPI00039F854F|nr:GumC family protein [Aureimonas ureilytica]
MFHSDSVAERVHGSESNFRQKPEEEMSLFDPATLARGIWSRRGLVVLTTLLGLGLAAAYAYSTPKLYTGVAQLVLDPRDLNIVQNDVTSAPGGMSTDATLALVESQIAVMTSHSVLERVVSKAGLTADPEFNGTRTSLLSGLTSVLSALFTSDDAAMVRDRQLLTISRFADHVKAARAPNSFVINVAVTSEDPEKAAQLANLLTETFIAEQGRAQSELARRATTALSSRLAELRQRVVSAEDAVEAYKAENRLVGVGGRLIDDDYITRVNSQLADVRSQITTLDVRAQSLRRASVNDVVEGSSPESLGSETLQRLRQAYTDAAQSAAVLSTRLGPRHPQRIAAEEAVATARRAIQNELGRIVASAQTELARARSTEADLSNQIDALRSRQIETSNSFVRLRELEREVDASRAVYEAYLLRTRQTSEQESLNTSNVRVISDATVPLQPSSLSRKVVAAVGGIAGLGIGLFLAALGTMLAILRGGASTRGEPGDGARSFGSEEPNAPLAPAGMRAAYGREADEIGAPSGARAEAWPLRGSAGEPVERLAMPVAAAAPVDRSADLPTEPLPSEELVTAPSLHESEYDREAEETAEFDENDGDLDRRRAELRDRIRAIGLRRSGARSVREIGPIENGEEAASTPAPADAAGSPDLPRASADEMRERISLTLAAARQRRSLLTQPSS